MSSIPIETFNQVQAVYIILVIAGFASAIIVGLIWFFKNMMRSKSGKKIDAAKIGHKQIVIAATPGHRANLFNVNQFLPGILETAKFKERVSKKRKVFYEPEKTEVILTENDLVGIENLSAEEKLRSIELTQQCLNYMLQTNTEKLFLEEGIPLTLAIEDKTITTGVKGIGAFNHYEKLHKIVNLKDKVEVLRKSPTFQDVGIYLSNLLSQVTLINIDVLRNYFDSDWDQSDDESQKEYYYTMGLRDGKKGEKGFEKWFIFGGIGIGIAGIVGGAVLAWLGK
jgi:hypothetical protein